MLPVVSHRLTTLIAATLCVAARALMLAQVYNTQGNQPTRMSLEDHILKETSVEPVDCGTHSGANVDADALHRSLACARDAIKQHSAFKVIQRGTSEDSEIADGLIGLRDGAVLWFDYNSGPCGGPGCNESFEARRADISSVLVIHDSWGTHRLWWVKR